MLHEDVGGVALDGEAAVGEHLVAAPDDLPVDRPLVCKVLVLLVGGLDAEKVRLDHLHVRSACHVRRREAVLTKRQPAGIATNASRAFGVAEGSAHLAVRVEIAAVVVEDVVPLDNKIVEELVVQIACMCSASMFAVRQTKPQQRHSTTVWRALQ